MGNIVKLKKENENEDIDEDKIHGFHLHLINKCGVGYYSFREFLENLEDEDILEEIDEYITQQREANDK